MVLKDKQLLGGRPMALASIHVHMHSSKSMGSLILNGFCIENKESFGKGLILYQKACILLFVPVGK